MTTKRKPDVAFGADKAVTFESIAEQVRSLNPNLLKEPQLDDVITIIEYLRDESINRFTLLCEKEVELTKRERELKARTKQVDIRSRAVECVLSQKPNRFWWRAVA